MPIQPLDLENNLLMSYLKDDSKNPSYVEKFNTARALLKRKPDRIKEIEQCKHKIEKKFGYKLSQLQKYYKSTRNLKAFIRPKKLGGERISMSRVKDMLEQFKLDMDEIVLDTFTRGGLEV
jgi:hypothetical protein